ncbi:MAG: biotin--[acetyl-CoA-carboxylase] ligase [Gemmataceae bacterium]|nr:biotin--[acetyl-CoA-carboxylase] ligase [Gemmataceae bacterium]
MTRRHVGVHVVRFDAVASTNDEAARLPVGSAVIARCQTAGRGQYGRTWTSPAGAGVWLSAVVELPDSLDRPAVATGWAAMGVARVCKSLAGLAPVAKWPNDVFVAGKKVAGILIEQRGRLIVGIGLNVNPSAEQLTDAGLPDAGSFRSLTGHEWNIDEVAERLLDELDRCFEELGSRPAEVQREWADLFAVVGSRVRVELADHAVVEGTLDRLTFDAVVLSKNGEKLRFDPRAVRQISRVAS